MADVVIREWTDEKGWIHRMEIPLKTFLREHDFEAVVRCKDCKWHEHEEAGMVWCPNMVGSWVDEDGYCSWGERKDEVTE